MEPQVDEQTSSPKNSNTPFHSLESAHHALQTGEFDKAAECYKQILSKLTEHHGETHPICAPVYYLYGLALMSTVRLPSNDDIFAAAPKEADYYQLLDKDETVEATGHGDLKIHTGPDLKGGVESENPANRLELAWNAVSKAWSILAEIQADSKLKVDVLSALGEISFKKDDFDNSFQYYLRALALLEPLVEPDDMRTAHLNYKICMSLPLEHQSLEATPYCTRSLEIVETRLQQLREEPNSSAGAEPMMTNTDHGQKSLKNIYSPKNSEIDNLTALVNRLRRKLEKSQ